MTIDHLLVARISLLAGLGVGLLSWRESVGHVGNVDVLVERSPLGATHGWCHVFREACGDVAITAVLLLVFFGPPPWRTGFTWAASAILMLGSHAPSWIGKPFPPAPSFLALALAFPSF